MFTGRHHTDETRKKMSESRLKRKETLGYLHSFETRKKLSLLHTGYRFSDASRRKISETIKKYYKNGGIKYWLGKKLSEETKKKMSTYAKDIGRKVSFSGRKHTEESKKKMSEKLKGRTFSEETRKKFSLARLGTHPTLETIEKLRNKIFTTEHRKNLSLANRGGNGSNWKGGVTPLLDQIRILLEYKQWRKTIFERDNYTCQQCKQRGAELNVDHYPKTFAQIFYENNISSLDDAMNCQEFWDINNGRTLCKDCHKKTDTWGRPRNKHFLQTGQVSISITK